MDDNRDAHLGVVPNPETGELQSESISDEERLTAIENQVSELGRAVQLLLQSQEELIENTKQAQIHQVPNPNTIGAGELQALERLSKIQGEWMKSHNKVLIEGIQLGVDIQTLKLRGEFAEERTSELSSYIDDLEDALSEIQEQSKTSKDFNAESILDTANKVIENIKNLQSGGGGGTGGPG